ncbi:MAG: hypothetical protein IKK84_00545 [Clostridia bacterium]|nr:hypothetical protein [Clostridia bacterium]
MESKNKYLKLCLDPELVKESRRIHRRAIFFSVAISIIVVIVALLMAYFLI